MMRRMNLLPASYAQRAKERRTKGLVIAGGILLLLALGGWRFMLGGQIGTAEEELANAQAQNATLQTKMDGLQRYAVMQTEVQTRAGSLLTVFTGDVAWPSILNDVALVTPENVWLTNMTVSAGETEGAAPVGTESSEIDIAKSAPFGRVQFQGKALEMTDVSMWMLRLKSVEEFQATWLNSATKEGGESGDGAGGSAAEVVTFDSSVELNPKASSVLRELEDLAGGKL